MSFSPRRAKAATRGFLWDGEEENMGEIINRSRERVRNSLESNAGLATVEIVLIVVVLIALVIIFQEQALTLVAKIWTTITENAENITG